MTKKKDRILYLVVPPSAKEGDILHYECINKKTGECKVVSAITKEEADYLNLSDEEKVRLFNEEIERIQKIK